MRVAPKLILSGGEREELERLARGRRVSVRLAGRAKMVLMAASGQTDSGIAVVLGVSRQNVSRWRSRFILSGIAGHRERCPAIGAQAANIGKTGAAGGADDDAGKARACDPMEYPKHGPGGRHQRGFR